MKIRIFPCLLIALAACLESAGRAADDRTICREGAGLLPPPATEKPGRKYMRDRLAQIHHLKLDVTPDFANRTIRGTSTLTLTPIAKPLPKLDLDSVGLIIDGVSAEGAALKEHEVTDERLVLVFDPPLALGARAIVTISYHGQPDRGLYFRTPEMGYKQGDTQVWSQGEPELHRYWYPGYDYPNQRFTSEVICHVPEGMKVVSNGSLASQAKGADGLLAWHWKQDKPHPNYLVALAAGYFHTIEDKLADLPLAISVPPSERDQASNAFRDTKKIIDFFQKETGFAFPWDKYHQVFCLDFLAGGMENTSCTFEAAGLLFRNDVEQLKSLHHLDAHETAHQWFGDLVTCRDWSHLWLNEGFASYYTVLYEEQKSGVDSMRYELWREAQRVFESLDTKPVVWRDYADPQFQFDYRVYPKGAWVLHMIRARLGPDLYRSCIKAYLERHRNGNVGTDDLQDVLEELSGLSFDQFFDQWLYHGGLPELKVEYSWDAAAKQAKLTVKQTQKISPEVLLFRLDLPVRFFVKGEDKPRDFNVVVNKAEQDYSFALPAAPELVRLDPEYTLLARTDFQPPPDMLRRQLRSDIIGRMLAVRQLSRKKDAETVKQLGETLNGDAFHAVRSEAAKALKTIATPEARAALAGSLKQDDARVRLAVVEALAAFAQPEAHDALWKLSESERNPLILGAIIRTWGARPGDPQVAVALRKQLVSSSHHQSVASAAIEALRAQDDATAVPAILGRLKRDGLEFPSFQLAQAFDALAFLARNDKDRDAVRAFFTEHLGHPREGLRVAAAKGLGTLRDPKAIAVLEPMTQTIKLFKDPVREAAEKSIQALEAEQTKKQELKDVWSKLQDLQKKAEEMQREIEKAKKKPEVPKVDQAGAAKGAKN